jgi:RNA polymerase sigma-70 factor (ECF subfamily)
MVGEDAMPQAWTSRDKAEPVDWEAVYREEMPRIYNFFRYRLGDRDLAEELTATTFEKAWRGRNRYRRDLAKFSTWLYAIARNVATDHLRRNRHSESNLEAAEAAAQTEGGLEAAIERKDNMRRLATLLTALAPREAELIALKYGAGLTNRSIAQLTGLSESNVGTILHRVVLRLRDAWEDEP